MSPRMAAMKNGSPPRLAASPIASRA